MKDLLESLNPEQKEAVLTTDGPLLVLAGAGSGKTKTLTHRIAYLIKEKNISPYNVLAVTFTNKAAREMADRVSHLLTANGQQSTAGGFRLPWLGTFHSVCVRILRREADFVGYSRSFTIYDDQDQLSVIKKIMKDLSINPKNFNPNSVSYFISGAKNELIDAVEYKKYINSPFEGVVSRVYERYQDYLKKANALDFDDLIMQTVLLFQQNPKILERYQNMFKYILIDEYQDTNEAQYVLVKMLASRYKNIMVVGDDYQSIYSWRGANFRNILNFEKDYKQAKVIKLEQNYRSTKTILEAANEVIKWNKNKKEKVLWTDNADGKPIIVYEALNEKDEAEFVAAEIRSLVSKSGYGNEARFGDVLGSRNQLTSGDTGVITDGRQTNYSDIAVLYRTNAQSRSVEETFLRFKIPYKVVGGVRFYDRKEIKDMVSYLRAILNPTDFVSLERAATCVPRGIGEKTFSQIREIPKSELLNPNQISNSAISKKLIGFLILIDDFRKQSLTLPLDRLILEIAERTGYKDHLLDGTPEGEGRWENILELIGVAEQAQKNYELGIMNKGGADTSLPSSRESTDSDTILDPRIHPSHEASEWHGESEDDVSVLEKFLEQVALVSDADKDTGEQGPVVTLMTLHSAKGLEFENVFIVGAEEGLFPHSRALLDMSEMEEERRLCYVGITRAKERLYIIHATERNLYGRFQCNPKSRFIEDIPEHIVESL